MEKIKLINEDLMLAFRDRLYESLGESIRTGKLVNTTGIRSVGKTTVLINFARSFQLPVIVACQSIADALIKTSGYKQIYCVGDSIRGKDFKRVLIDEGVNTDRLNQMGFEVLGGYYCVQEMYI